MQKSEMMKSYCSHFNFQVPLNSSVFVWVFHFPAWCHPARFDVRKEKIAEWLKIRKPDTEPRILPFGERPRLCLFEGRSKAAVGFHHVLLHICLETHENFSNYFADCPIFQRYGMLSVGGPLERHFESLLSMNNNDENKFNKACKYILTEMMEGCTRLSGKRGSPDRSLMVLLKRLQTNNEKMQRAFSEFPEGMGSEKPNIFHMLIVDFLGRFFQQEFLMTVKAISNGEEWERSNDLVQAAAYEVRKQQEADSACVPPAQQPTLTEMASNIHKFLGYAVASFKNTIVSHQEAYGELEYALLESTLNAMTTCSEDIVQKLLRTKDSKDVETRSERWNKTLFRRSSRWFNGCSMVVCSLISCRCVC